MIIKTQIRKGYDAISVLSENMQDMCKVYVRSDGLVSNLYVRKKYRKDGLTILKYLFNALEIFYFDKKLYGYVSPKDKHRINAVFRLYGMLGFKVAHGNKMIKK